MTYRHIDTAQATPVQLGAMGKIEIIEEIKRLRALVKELTAGLGIYVHAHDIGNAVPPYIVSRAHELLAKSREIAP